MKYLIFGNNGQLGTELTDQLDNKEIDCVGVDLPDYDISNFVIVSKLISNEKPDVVVNCAAYNSVDMAEMSFEDAYRTNSIGPENIAIVCKREGIKFVHFSSNYVFDGERFKAGLYTEDDIPNPINNYGITKYEGEQLVFAANKDTLIFRTSWLYGNGEHNFIRKIIDLNKADKHLKVVDDEIASPTSTALAAGLVIKAVNNNLTGLYNLNATGYCSRYDWAKEIINEFKLNSILYPVKLKDITLIAKRPSFSAMNNMKLAKALQIDIPYWKDDFKNYSNMQINKTKSRQSNLRKLRNETGMMNN